MSFLGSSGGVDNKYARLESESPASSSATSSIAVAIPKSSASLSPASQKAIQKLNTLPIKAMSLVGFKNLFFQRTLVPKRVQPEPASRTPLLSNEGRTEYVSGHYSNLREGSISDLESQTTIAESRHEKASQQKGWRIDARIISDATIGLSDGLTVPFALTAGLSALGDTNIVIWGGFAELVAGAISMGLGGYMAAKGEAAFYQNQRDEVEELVASDPQAANDAIMEIFEPYDMPPSALEEMIVRLSKSSHLVDFIMKVQHCAEKPDSFRATTSSITIALGYFLGGLLPLIPYIFVGKHAVYQGLYMSIGVMVIALFLFGYTKTCVVIGWRGGRQIRSGCVEGIKMVVVGSIAAAAAMGLVKFFSHEDASTGAAHF